MKTLYKHGVYRIRNIINNHCYIGSSAGKGFHNRFNLHVASLENNNHHSIYLQRAWNKYGKDCFVFEVLLYCDPDRALEYEQLLFNFYKPNYNVSLVAGSNLGIKRRQSTKDKIGAIHRGKLVSIESRCKMADYHKSNNTAMRMMTSEARLKAKQSRLNSDHRGEKIYNSKTSSEQVIRIRNLYSGGMNYNQISKIFTNLDRRTIRDICIKRTWKHV